MPLHRGWHRPPLGALQALLIFSLIVVQARLVHASDKTETWNGATGDWSDATRWGPDQLVPNNGAFTFDASIGVGTLTQDIAAGVTIENLAVSGGTLILENPLTWNDFLTLSGGTLSIAVQHSFNNVTWTGGTLTGTGTKTIPAGGLLSASGSFSKGLGSGGLENAGTIESTGNGEWVGGVGSASTIRNLGLFDVQDDAAFSWSTVSSNVFENLGTFRKSAGAGTTSFVGWTFDNTGIVEVETGILSLPGGSETGSYDVAVDSVLQFNGPRDLTTTTLGGAGEVQFSAGAINAAPSTFGPALHGPILLNGSTLSIAEDVTFSSLTWHSGTLTGAGTKTIPAGSVLLVADSVSKGLGGGVLENAGRIEWTGSGEWVGGVGSASTIRNLGLFDVQDDAAFSWSTVSSNVFDNLGTFRKSAGAGTTSFVGWTFDNNGIVEVQSGTVSLDGVAQLLDSTLTDGEWIVGPSARLSITIGSNIAINQADVTLVGAGSVFARINTLADNQGRFNILNARSFTTVGSLLNSGVITVGDGSLFAVHGDLNVSLASGRVQIGAEPAVDSDDVGTGELHVYAGGVSPEATVPSSAIDRHWLDIVSGYNGGDWSGTGIAGGRINDANRNGIGMTLEAPAGSAEYLIIREMILGDVNGDDFVDAGDVSVLVSNLGTAGTWLDGDSNYDSFIDGGDAAVLFSHNGFAFDPGFGPTLGVAVPEPSTLALAAVSLSPLLAAVGMRPQRTSNEERRVRERIGERNRSSAPICRR